MVSHTFQNKQSISNHKIHTLFVFAYRMSAQKTAPTLHINLGIIEMIRIIYSVISVCERLFDELVKEWLQNRYSIVSGSFRETDDRRIRIRKGHLRRKRQ